MEGPHEDLYGHGTACAGIIRTLAPDCEIHSVRVLGSKLTGKGFVFAAGLDWALREGMRVVNLSLSTGKRDYYSVFHRLADEAAFKRVMLVCAINNMPGLELPRAVLVGVLGRLARGRRRPDRVRLQPDRRRRNGERPASTSRCRGWTARRSWRPGTRSRRRTSRASSTLILPKHPELTPFQAKTVLMALARNVRS